MSDCIKGKASQLDHRGGTVSYEISKDEHGLYLKITGNNKGGHSTAKGKPVYLSELLALIVPKVPSGGSFRREDVEQAIPGASTNDPGFVVAILKDIGLVEGDRGSYRLRSQRQGG